MNIGKRVSEYRGTLTTKEVLLISSQLQVIQTAYEGRSRSHAPDDADESEHDVKQLVPALHASRRGDASQTSRIPIHGAVNFLNQCSSMIFEKAKKLPVTW